MAKEFPRGLGKKCLNEYALRCNLVDLSNFTYSVLGQGMLASLTWIICLISMYCFSTCRRQKIHYIAGICLSDEKWRANR